MVERSRVRIHELAFADPVPVSVFGSSMHGYSHARRILVGFPIRHVFTVIYYTNTKAVLNNFLWHRIRHQFLAALFALEIQRRRSLVVGAWAAERRDREVPGSSPQNDNCRFCHRRCFRSSLQIILTHDESFLDSHSSICLSLCHPSLFNDLIWHRIRVWCVTSA